MFYGRGSVGDIVSFMVSVAFERVHSVTLIFLHFAQCKADNSIIPYLFPVILAVEQCVV